MKLHRYKATISWTGDLGNGTSGYKNYSRDHAISIKGKPTIEGSSDPDFRGNKEKYSPEDLLVTSLSACHMLWYLHLCSVNDVIVTEYVDHVVGVMEETSDGSGQFTEVILYPEVHVTETGMINRATSLHADAHKMCFIARSVKFPVRHVATIKAS